MSDRIENKFFHIPTNTPSSKNNRRWTGRYFIVSKRTADWKKITKSDWIGQKQDFLEELKKTTKPYYIELTFNRKSKHKFDYINICQGVADAMVEHGWLNDDNADEVKFFFADYEYNKDNPGVIIKIIDKTSLRYDIQK